jgi:folate-binding protein YgfZ
MSTEGTTDATRSAPLSPAAAYGAFRGGSALLVPVRDVDPIRVTGADRLDFVHGQVSNDVKGLAAGQTREGLLLNHKGHALAQLRTVRRDDDLYLAVESGAGAFVRDHFDRHIVFDQVEVRDLAGDLTTWTLQGAERGVAAALAALGAHAPAVGSTVSVPFGDAAVLVTPSRRSGASGVDVHLLTRQAGAVQAALVGAGARVADPAVLPLLRVVAGVPHAGTEAGEGVLPQEAGLEPLVSYRKGCYLGQEIMARIEGRGAVRRSLRGVALDAEPPEREVRVGERTVGRLGTVVEHPELGWIGLVVVRDDLGDGDRGDGVEISFGGVRGELRDPPFEHAPA